MIENAKQWLSPEFDDETRKEVQTLIDKNNDELVDAFYRNLEFGTGGLRGIMGVGTNRMNKYTVGMATQGLANYLKKCFPNRQISAAIAHDSRNNSTLFANITADVLSANGIKVYLFDDMRPTPELSFAVRYLKCQTGVVVTASHNPKEYNGYKVYWEDGAQIIAPHDVKIIEEVNNIKSITSVNFKRNKDLINIIGENIDNVYLNKVYELSLHRDAVERNGNMSIVYTPLHGTGIKLVPKALAMYGFKNISLVEEQCVPDGNFPTVKSPNPEEGTAFEYAIRLAKKVNADFIIATDPDADRIGLAVKNKTGEYQLLNGNQTAAILFYYIIKNRKPNTLPYYIVKTIVTTDLLNDIAKSEGIEVFECLTGFKYIASVIRKYEGKMKFLVGGEESYGYLCGDFVRDKDSIMSSCLLAEAAAWAKDKNMSLLDMLEAIYDKFGRYTESMTSVVKKGKDGAAEIKAMMADYRNNPPKEMEGKKVVEIRDYQMLKATNYVDGTVKDIDMPVSDVLQFFLEDGTKLSVRPSGTEPKIKYYRSEHNNI
ncbi:MAG: phospho-sugar mutase [Bacteroidales bacterium]|nr:phospho-sugar mutase [Bacteroidales bacterium]MDD2204674.1 phospho-sugar mutase [Bacteroidales bacterium]MDD3152780.1 phospho-sugar mutase [Bacteroidales bacterium]MDD3913651.1 phospho-sugar mutase [Bacteroidales bacterium]MDD4633902.1 phospho-sugar mutase [Bacteroidales bacterium]